MPFQPLAPRGPRCFARIDRFHCECPNCGQLIVAAMDAETLGRVPQALRRRKRRTTLYNPITGKLTCHACRMVFGVGLLLWPMAPGGGNPYTLPEDWEPKRRHLTALRAYLEGVWPEEAKRPGEARNVVVTQPCPCTGGVVVPSCPVHGLGGSDR